MIEINQQQAALDLRLAQAAERNGIESEEPVVEQPEMSLRQRLAAKRKAEKYKYAADERLDRARIRTEERFIKASSARALRAAWLSEGTIVGFLFGLAYINLHVFLRLVFGPDMFCKLGEEWSLGKAGSVGKTASIGAFWAEVLQLIFFDLLIFGAVAYSIFWLYLLAELINIPSWETVKEVGILFFEPLWELIKTNMTS